MALYTLTPNAPGSDNAFLLVGAAATRWEALSTDDGDTNYVREVTNGARQGVQCGTIPIPVAAIASVTVKPKAKVVAAVSPAINSYVYPTATRYFGGGAQAITTGYVAYSKAFTTNPDTGAAWLKAAVDGADYGWEHAGDGGGGDDIYVTYLTVDVSLTPASGGFAFLIGSVLLGLCGPALMAQEIPAMLRAISALTGRWRFSLADMKKAQEELNPLGRHIIEFPYTDYDWARG